ncbi:SDR family oxidoreductase [Rhizobium sp. YIM 134829]|uniref:SDR family oxidoreductase n=1 Tax=Rhizobium sp. YIM 134829 TaxID=3390453 RepID=UPI00397C4D84
MKLTGNTILIIGGTSGIGLALAEAFESRGNTVVIAGRRRERLDEIKTAYPRVEGFALDVDSPEAISAFAADIRKRFPALNVLVNNAGISRSEDLSSSKDWLGVAESVISTNILGVLRVTAELLPLLAGQSHSTVITTTSGLAFVPRSAYPTYCASKAFLHSWLQSLRVQLRTSSIEVLELAPPYVQTELAGAAQAIDPNAMPLADYIAEVMDLLGHEDHPDGEILVERVRALRTAEKGGRYGQIFASMNSLV